VKIRLKTNNTDTQQGAAGASVKQHLLISALLLSLFTTGCTERKQAPQVGLLSGAGFLKQWEAPLGLSRDPIRALYLRNEQLIAYSSSNRAYFVDAAAGNLIGLDRAASEGYRLFPPIALTDFFAIPTTSTIEVFDKQAHRVGSMKPLLPIQGPGTGNGNSLYIATSSSTGRVSRYEVTDTQLHFVWDLYTSARLQAAPVVFSDAVYAGGTDGKVWAVTANRLQLWNIPNGVFQTDGPITADLAVDEFGLYVASQDKKLYCLDRSSGKIKWNYYADSALLDGPVVIGNNVFQMVPGVGLVCINKTEGNFTRDAMWTQSAARQVLSADEKYVYVRGGGNSILALDRGTGQIAFQNTRTDLTVFATNLSSPTIFAATRAGSVLAIHPVTKPGETGEIVFETTTVREQLASAE
jgi:hypothetical protein